jgi:hypothetical protein
VESAISGSTEAFGALAAAADLGLGSTARQGPAPRMRRKK